VNAEVGVLAEADLRLLVAELGGIDAAQALAALKQEHHGLLARSENGTFPLLRESTPVRMDLSHSCWSDVFFLGMDYPEGARVLNVSIDLGVHGRDATPKPPVEAYLRVIDSPVLRLTSVDLATTAEISDLGEVFDFARDYLGLLKAAVIAAGIVPPGVEGSGASLADLLAQQVELHAHRVVERPAVGHVVDHVLDGLVPLDERTQKRDERRLVLELPGQARNRVVTVRRDGLAHVHPMVMSPAAIVT
jgi:hypothetical protein